MTYSRGTGASLGGGLAPRPERLQNAQLSRTVRSVRAVKNVAPTLPSRLMLSVPASDYPNDNSISNDTFNGADNFGITIGTVTVLKVTSDFLIFGY